MLAQQDDTTLRAVLGQDIDIHRVHIRPVNHTKAAITLNSLKASLIGRHILTCSNQSKDRACCLTSSGAQGPWYL